MLLIKSLYSSRNPKKMFLEMYHGFHKVIKQENSFQIIKSAY